MKDYSELMLEIEKNMKECHHAILKGNFNTASYYASYISGKGLDLSFELSLLAEKKDKQNGK